MMWDGETGADPRIDSRRLDSRPWLQQIYNERGEDRRCGWMSTLPNVHVMVSAEDKQRADERIAVLLDTPASVRGVSLEPLLGPMT